MSELNISFTGVNLVENGFPRDFNDGGIDLKCEQENALLSFDDKMKISKQFDHDGYDVYVRFSSEVNVPIFNDGMVYLKYSGASKHFQLYGLGGSFDQDVLIYNPEHVLKNVVAGLKCYAQSTEADPEDSKSVLELAGDIERDIDNIVATYAPRNQRKEIMAHVNAEAQRFREAMHFFGGDSSDVIYYGDFYRYR